MRLSEIPWWKSDDSTISMACRDGPESTTLYFCNNDVFWCLAAAEWFIVRVAYDSVTVKRVNHLRGQHTRKPRQLPCRHTTFVPSFKSTGLMMCDLTGQTHKSSRLASVPSSKKAEDMTSVHGLCWQGSRAMARNQGHYTSKISFKSRLRAANGQLQPWFPPIKLHLRASYLILQKTNSSYHATCEPIGAKSFRVCGTAWTGPINKSCETKLSLPRFVDGKVCCDWSDTRPNQ
ncbi:hypothetical protein BR93DRAFT_600093 [Coniochaeta sp. PMI_546]|nr:hypothetical protein BR93DRAFT_600093 [Coniochaeta sp. PMI_546]